MELRHILLHSALLCAYLVVGKQLRGVNKSGFEYACVQNKGLVDGPMDDSAIELMKSWKINIVRVPLNEDCWLGLHGQVHNQNYIGQVYRDAVVEYVTRLRNHGLTVIVDLHWTDGLYGGPGQGACYDFEANCQKPMPDKEFAPQFWTSVANTFKNDDGIIFELFNEPFHDQFMQDSTAAWTCLRDGGSACPGAQFEFAGMQDLLNAVRNTGAKNLVMVPGLAWTNDLSRWLEFIPHDPLNRLAAAWHAYDINECNTQDCWEKNVAPVAAKYPIFTTEIGGHDCTHNYIDRLMPWMDSKNINYLGWTWNTWDCATGPSLISDYNGTPSGFGQGFKNHLWNTQ